MFATKEAVNSTMVTMVRNLKQRGCKVMFLGLGGLRYDESEKKVFTEFLTEIQPSLIITRDKKTYEMYKDCTNCVQGIDCALWVSEVYNPKGFARNKYTISAFNYTEEPICIQNEINVVRPFHFPYVLSRESEIIKKKNVMLSDSPYDYLMLYANADKVYTDLVHATLISLMYGTPVKYYSFDNRKDAFESLTWLTESENGFLYLSSNELEKNKKYVENIVLNALK